MRSSHGRERRSPVSSAVWPTNASPLELARLVREISRRGEQESAACQKILQGFADYLRSRPEDSDDLMGDFGK